MRLEPYSALETLIIFIVMEKWRRKQNGHDEVQQMRGNSENKQTHSLDKAMLIVSPQQNYSGSCLNNIINIRKVINNEYFLSLYLFMKTISESVLIPTSRTPNLHVQYINLRVTHLLIYIIVEVIHYSAFIRHMSSNKTST